MNAFFASCEQQDNVGYRHKPVAVTPINTDTGCIISPSYEAKAYGVKTGCSVREAKKLCPGIIIIEAHVKKYLQFNQQLVRVLFNFSPFVTVKSVDEAVICLSPAEKNSEVALKLAQDIKYQISKIKYLRF